MTRIRGRSAAAAVALFIFFSALTVGGYELLTHRINHNARDAYVTACGRVNRLAGKVDGFIAGQLDRSTRANKATIDSPTATPEQKAAARVNQASLVKFIEGLNQTLAPEPCTYPPVSS